MAKKKQVDVGGRPRVEIDPAFVRELSRLGMSQEDIAKRMGVKLRTLERRLAEDEEVRLAHEQGKAEGVEELLTCARKGVKEGQPALTIFSLKNLAGWSDKQKIEADVNVSGWSNIARLIAEGKVPKDEPVEDENNEDG